MVKTQGRHLLKSQLSSLDLSSNTSFLYLVILAYQLNTVQHKIWVLRQTQNFAQFLKSSFLL